jgi:hypothetical protein
VTARLLMLPTKDDVANLRVGDLAPNCFGALAEVTEICYRGVDVEGHAYVGYYTRTGPTSSMSMSMKEGELVRHAGLLQTSAELDSIERRMRAEKAGA